MRHGPAICRLFSLPVAVLALLLAGPASARGFGEIWLDLREVLAGGAHVGQTPEEVIRDGVLLPALGAAAAANGIPGAWAERHLRGWLMSVNRQRLLALDGLDPVVLAIARGGAMFGALEQAGLAEAVLAIVAGDSSRADGLLLRAAREAEGENLAFLREIGEFRATLSVFLGRPYEAARRFRQLAGLRPPGEQPGDSGPELFRLTGLLAAGVMKAPGNTPGNRDMFLRCQETVAAFLAAGGSRSGRYFPESLLACMDIAGHSGAAPPGEEGGWIDAQAGLLERVFLPASPEAAQALPAWVAVMACDHFRRRVVLARVRSAPGSTSRPGGLFMPGQGEFPPRPGTGPVMDDRTAGYVRLSADACEQAVAGAGGDRPLLRAAMQIRVAEASLDLSRFRDGADSAGRAIGIAGSRISRPLFLAYTATFLSLLLEQAVQEDDRELLERILQRLADLVRDQATVRADRSFHGRFRQLLERGLVPGGPLLRSPGPEPPAGEDSEQVRDGLVPPGTAPAF